MAKGKYEQWLEPEGLLQLEAWARNGLTNEQIAHNMGISRETLNQWCKKYADISDTLKKGKEVVDTMVENALLKRALGYSYTEVTRQLVQNPKTGKTELKVTKEIEKQMPPDVTAIIYWLKNRKPEIWKDKQNIEISGELQQEKTKLDNIISQIRAGKSISGNTNGGDDP